MSDTSCPESVRRVLAQIGVLPYQEVLLRRSQQLRNKIFPLREKVYQNLPLTSEEHQQLLGLCERLEELTVQAARYTSK